MHFEAVARILGWYGANEDLIIEFMRYFQDMNPSFDPVRFRRAVNIARGNA